jgi:hypothetical protein
MNAIPSIPEQTEAKSKRIPPKISQIVDWLVTGACKNQQAACERANLDPSYVSRELRKVHVRVFIDRKVRDSIANGTMRAGARLLELLDSDSDHVSLDAVKHQLARNGIKPANDAQLSVSLDVRAGIVIDLREPDQTMRDVTPSTSPRR